MLYLTLCTYYFGRKPCLILSLWAEKKSAKLDRNKISTSSTKFVWFLFRLIGKTRSPPGLWLAETFSTSPLNPLNGIKRNLTGISAFSTKCVFVWPTGKIQDGHPASDWLRYFWFLLRNSRTELNETWLEARSQRPLPCLWFSGSIRKQDDRPDLTLADTFSTSLK